MRWPVQLSQSSTKGFLWYITFWAFLPSEQSLTAWVKLTKGHHNYLTLSRHHLYWNEPVGRYNTAGIVKPTTVFSWLNNGAEKVSETCTFIGLKNTPEMWVYSHYFMLQHGAFITNDGCATRSKATIPKDSRPFKSGIYFSNSIPRWAFMELHLLWFLGQETLNLLFC